MQYVDELWNIHFKYPSQIAPQEKIPWSNRPPVNDYTLNQNMLNKLQNTQSKKCDLIKNLIAFNLCHVNCIFNKTNTNKRVKGRG